MLDRQLADALAGGQFDVIVTSSQRLARSVRRAMALQQLDAGNAAWESAPVLPWSAWLRQRYQALCFESTDTSVTDALLLSASQAHSIWLAAVRTVSDTLSQPLVGQEQIAQDALAAFSLLQRYCVDDDTLRNSVRDEDSAFFARCLNEVRRRQRQSNWLFEEELGAVLMRHSRQVRKSLPASVLLAGFEQMTPMQEMLIERLGADTFTRLQLQTDGQIEAAVSALESHQDEIVAAGQWARSMLTEKPGASVAVIVPGLSAETAQVRRWFADGFQPGWQCATPNARHRLGFEVSYGQPLSSYPAIADALHCLRVATAAPRFLDLSRLLRSPLLASDQTSAMVLEARLRAVPDRAWSLAALMSFCAPLPVPNWLECAATLHGEAQTAQLPSVWAERIHDYLMACGWLADIDIDSDVFQLRDAFFSALNRLASLDAVIGGCVLVEACSGLNRVLGDTLYQPEGGAANVLVAGPLETLGMRFDAMRIVGLDTSRWPVAAQPSNLLDRQLQRRYRMPDASAEQTAAFWQRQFDVLCASADQLHCSYALNEADSLLLPAPALRRLMADRSPTATAVCVGLASLADSRDVNGEVEQIGGFDPSRRVHGGYRVLEWQQSDPLSALFVGRWQCDPLSDPALGVSPRLRGQVLHAALEQIYSEITDSDALRALTHEQIGEHAKRAVGSEMASAFHHADSLLTRLLRLEEQRARRLVARVLTEDQRRGDFVVASVEQRRELSLEGLRIALRVDRVDRIGERQLIIDYKTSVSHSAVREDTILQRHLQLVVYALTVSDPAELAGVALAMVNPADQYLVGLIDADDAAAAGIASLRKVTHFQSLIGDWRESVLRIARGFRDGDIRLNARLGREQRLPFAVLSRYAEETSQ